LTAVNTIWKNSPELFYVKAVSIFTDSEKTDPDLWMQSVSMTWHLRVWGVGWMKSRINRKTMVNKQTKTSNSINSRRTGLDRRWIPSIDHQPERRSGKDRRSIQNRSFLEPIESPDQKGHQFPFPAIHGNAVSPGANDSIGAISEKNLSQTPETVGVDDVSDDRPDIR
jgi:hypothetical protein